MANNSMSHEQVKSTCDRLEETIGKNQQSPDIGKIKPKPSGKSGASGKESGFHGHGRGRTSYR